MSSIADILASRAREEPAEIAIIKEFVRETFRSQVSVSMQTRQIIITTPSAALAGSLRMHSHTLRELCQTDKKLIIRIGTLAS